MSTKTLTLKDRSFTVRTEVAQTISGMQNESFKNIQHMLVVFFSKLDDVYSDEYALAITVYFPDSNAPEARQSRCAADVRKYNNGELSSQDSAPEDQVKHLDGGTRRSGRNAKVERKLLDDLNNALNS